MSAAAARLASRVSAPEPHPLPARRCAATVALDDLGLEQHDTLRVRRALQQPLGLILVAGPGQSGRSTTLAALLRAVPATLAVAPEAQPPAAAARNAHGDCLVLDPAPCSEGLRRALATVPSGRRVFSCVDLERAAHVFGHYAAHGLTPATLARDLLLVIAQQRVHRLCEQCRDPDRSADLRGVMAQAANSWLEGVALTPCHAHAGGCANCAGTGYRGCALLYELLPMDSGVRAMVESGVTGLEMEQTLFCDGRSLWDQGLRLIARGVCSLAALRAAVREPG